jgi:hypothetical protein
MADDTGRRQRRCGACNQASDTPRGVEWQPYATEDEFRGEKGKFDDLPAGFEDEEIDEDEVGASGGGRGGGVDRREGAGWECVVGCLTPRSLEKTVSCAPISLCLSPLPHSHRRSLASPSLAVFSFGFFLATQSLPIRQQKVIPHHTAAQHRVALTLRLFAFSPQCFTV